MNSELIGSKTWGRGSSKMSIVVRCMKKCEVKNMSQQNYKSVVRCKI